MQQVYQTCSRRELAGHGALTDATPTNDVTVLQYSGAMPRQHYIPAAFLGRFSAETTLPIRERPLWVRRRGRPDAFLTNAENVAFGDDMYVLTGEGWGGQPRDAIDKVWRGYEPRLADALDRLAHNEGVSADLWLRVLVPFVTSIFARGKEFDRGFNATPVIRAVAEMPFTDDPDWFRNNLNTARIIRLQRLMAPVMAAKWIVMHTGVDETTIMNDVGYTSVLAPDGESTGLVLPLGPHAILCLIAAPPDRGDPILRDAGGGQWEALVDHLMLPPGDYLGFNQAMAEIAQEFIVGPTAASVDGFADALDRDSVSPQECETAFWPTPRMQVVHELEWYRAVSAVQHHATPANCGRFDIDWQAVAQGWHPEPVFLSVNLPQFPTGLVLDGNLIGLVMSGVPGFTDAGPSDPFPWEVSEAKPTRRRLTSAIARRARWLQKQICRMRPPE